MITIKITFSFVVCLLLGIFQAKGQLQDANNAIQLSDEFDKEQGRVSFYAENRDYCDYYLYIAFVYSEGFSGMTTSRPVVVNPGKETIMSFKVIEGAARYGYNYRYTMFRGNINKKPNVDFTYALPATDRQTVVANITENRDGYQLSFELPSDTAYACRGGVVCNDELKDNTSKGFKNFNSNQALNQVTLYHPDGSFGEYIFKGKSLVYPGESLKIGTPIAVVERHFVNFSTYLLYGNKVKNSKVGNKHTHFRPFFQTENAGKLRLERERAYVSQLNDEMRMQDMSKGQQKKFLKAKMTK